EGDAGRGQQDRRRQKGGRPHREDLSRQEAGQSRFRSQRLPLPRAHQSSGRRSTRSRTEFLMAIASGFISSAGERRRPGGPEGGAGRLLASFKSRLPSVSERRRP